MMEQHKHTSSPSRRVLVAGRDIPLPIFFPSVSSVKTNLAPTECLRVLVAFRYPRFLVSAYDLNSTTNKKRMSGYLNKGVKNGAAVLMDSGNYESYWRQDTRWTVSKYVGALKDTNPHLAFSFDNQAPLTSVASNVEDIEKSVISTLKKVPKASVIPIIHGRSSVLPEIARRVAERLRPLMIAIPERALGEGLIARVKTLTSIRRKMEDLAEYVPIHLLGTGNPLSLLLFSAYGADSFDGLEWCQTAVDHSTGLLYHFQQREFFACQCSFCKTPNLPYSQATLAHNLDFYMKWMDYLRSIIADNRFEEALAEHFSAEFLSDLRNEMVRS
jgi:queuine/archaeosine tRNA-ribosyltransferase